MEENVEDEFLYRVHLGHSLVSFRPLDPWYAVVPLHNGILLEADSPMLDEFPGLSSWWRKADALFRETPAHPSAVGTLTKQLNYAGKLTCQFPLAEHRVIYRKSSGRPIAAYLAADDALIDNGLFWAPVRSAAEAHYLVAILNSEVVVRLVAPLLSVGQFGERNVNRHVLDLPIPEFDPSGANHLELAALGNAAAVEALGLQLPVDDQPSSQRAALDHLRRAGIVPRIERLVEEMLASSRPNAPVSSTLRRNSQSIAQRGAALFDADEI